MLYNYCCSCHSRLPVMRRTCSQLVTPTQCYAICMSVLQVKRLAVTSRSRHCSLARLTFLSATMRPVRLTKTNMSITPQAPENIPSPPNHTWLRSTESDLIPLNTCIGPPYMRGMKEGNFHGRQTLPERDVVTSCDPF